MLRICALALLAIPALAGTNQEGLDFLAAKAKEDGVVKLPSGLLYKELVKGTSNKSCGLRQVAKVHFKGSHIDGTVFNGGTYKRGSLANIVPVHTNPGWKEAMTTMTEGSKWELYIPSELAYGDEGYHKVPGGSALVYELEIVELTDQHIDRFN